MALIRSQTVLPFFTNVPEDVATNTLYWLTADASQATCTEIVGRLGAFYNALGDRLAPCINRTGGIPHKLYNMADPEPRQPLFPGWSTSMINSASTTNLPLECAITVSYHSQFTSGTPNARKRGRFYLGPLGSAVLDYGSSAAFPSIGATLRNEIATAVALLWTTISVATVEWAQYSPTNGTAEIVAGGWIDNELDTQRRRQNKASARTTFVNPA